MENKIKNWFRDKKGGLDLVPDNLGKILIGLAILIIILIGIGIITGKGIAALNYIGKLFRFR